MKKKLGMIIAVLAIATLLVTMFAVSVSADDAITVTYNWHGGSVRATAKANEDGSYTLRSEKLSGNATSTLTDGTVVDREFYGWYDEEGNLYSPGETVTFTKSTRLYEAYGITIYNAEDLDALDGTCYLKLGADITTDKDMNRDWSINIINLNGHTLTCTGSHVAHIRRGSFVVHGPGKIVHAPTTVKTGIDECAVFIYSHGYGDDDCPQQFWIGKDVELTTPYSALRIGSVARDKHPKIAISGTVNARALARISPVVKGSTCTIYESANITTSDSFIEFANQTGIESYMTISLNGKINIANGTGVIIDEFVLEKVDIDVEGGSFCVADSDIENIAYYLPDTLMLSEKTDGELTWQEIVPSDCVHSWIKDNEQSVEATLNSFGLDVFDCEICGRTKSIVTVYDPSNTEITIVVRTTEGEGEEQVITDTEVVVRAGDVLDFVVVGVGENTSYSLSGVKGNELYPASSIVAIDVPVGIGAIDMKSANAALETINIVDGVNVSVTSLAGLTGIKTLNIGAATVIVSGIGGNYLESINSSVAGANVSFLSSCFDGKTALKYLTMANGSSYTFGANSFRGTSIETVIFPDESTIIFAGDAAFYNAKVKYAYFGDSITSINKKPFDCANDLQLVVIKAATFIDQYCFCVAGANNSTSVLKVYCHSGDVSINNNAFVNRENNGVEFYTIDPDIKSLSGCKYTVYNGIPHAYTEGVVKEPTCISTGIAGSTTDCVCGVNEIVTYTVYTASGSEERSTEQREIPVSDVHVLGSTFAGINYANGYDKEGARVYYCQVCGAEKVEDTSDVAAPVFEFIGYSAPETGEGGIVIGYMVNIDIVNELRALDDVTFRYGMFVVSKAKLGENDIFDENGNPAKGVLHAYTSAQDFVMFEMKIVGFTTEEQKNAKFAVGAFAVMTEGEKKKISYIQDGTAADGEKYYFASFNEMIG